jgi:hypothetical protein
MLSNDTADCNGQLAGRARPSLEVNNLDLRLPSDPHRVWREKVGPNPVMMIDDLVRTEMRSVAHRVAVGDRDHFKAQRSGGTNSRIDAKVCGPPCHQDALRA